MTATNPGLSETRQQPEAPSAAAEGLDAKQAKLEAVITDIGPMIVAFSGGVDSSLLALAAHRTLGSQMLAVTADSASLAQGELAQCRTLAENWSIGWASVATDELTNPRYVANESDRCYWCKTALMDQLEGVATERAATVTLGVNIDDLGDHRPGQQAAAARGARFPLVEAGFTKQDVRDLAKMWGLEVWDRPAMPCLSSRLPYGTPVTVPLLSRIDRAEAAVRRLGFDDVRVRHYDDTARIELPAPRLGDAVSLAAEIVAAVTAAGYRYVTLDLAGLRSGNLNHAVSADNTATATTGRSADGS